MKYLEFRKTLNLMDDKKYIENYLLYNVATVIAGIKPSVTITLKINEENIYEKWCKYGTRFIREIGLDYIELRRNSKAKIILVYNEVKLREIIFSKYEKEFLINLGYCQEEDIQMYLKKLQERYLLYKCPHELGIFLGIPLDDVKDFMNCSGKKCLLCGYWKVYNDFDFAVKTFKKFDEVKKSTINNIIKGKDIFQHVLELKYYFNM